MPPRVVHTQVTAKPCPYTAFPRNSHVPDAKGNAPHVGHSTWDYERSLSATSRFVSMTHKSKPTSELAPDQPLDEDGRSIRVAGRSVNNPIQPPTVPIMEERRGSVCHSLMDPMESRMIEPTSGEAGCHSSFLTTCTMCC
jgi:hypothetical protein